MDVKQFCDMPINPKALHGIREQYDPKAYPGDSVNVPTASIAAKSEVFVLMREIARMFVNGTEWNKKARIVLEYDPQVEKLEIKTFMERDEAIPVADRQSFLE